MAYYMIRDWTETGVRPGGGEYTNGPPPVELVCGVEELVAAIDRAKEGGRRISVYEVGKCLLDWS